MVTCRDCYWVGEEDDLVSAVSQLGTDPEDTCPDCGSDYIMPLEEATG